MIDMLNAEKLKYESTKHEDDILFYNKRFFIYKANRITMHLSDLLSGKYFKLNSRLKKVVYVIFPLNLMT